MAASLVRTLPWQAKMLMKMFGVTAKDDDADADGSGQLSVPTSRLQERLRWLFVVAARVQTWMSSHRRTFGLLTRACVFSFLGLALLRRVGNWYKGMAEYEILLDRTDHDYQAYGCTLNGIGTTLLSSINQTAVTQYKHTQLCRRLVAALDAPCFPQMMTDYAVQVSGLGFAAVAAACCLLLRLLSSLVFASHTHPSTQNSLTHSLAHSLTHSLLLLPLSSLSPLLPSFPSPPLPPADGARGGVAAGRGRRLPQAKGQGQAQTAPGPASGPVAVAVWV